MACKKIIDSNVDDSLYHDLADIGFLPSRKELKEFKE